MCMSKFMHAYLRSVYFTLYKFYVNKREVKKRRIKPPNVGHNLNIRLLNSERKILSNIMK
jgi:hypothetical protein